MITLSPRNRQILKMLYNADSLLTTKKIAEQMHISMRTIQYDLRNLEEWAQENQVELSVRPHVGICLVNKEQVKSIIEEGKEPEPDAVPTNEERVQTISMDLLEASQPVRVVDLMTRLDVSKSTVLGDLDKVEEYFKSRQIRFERTKKGISVLEPEAVRRKEILELIYSSVNKRRMIEYFFHSDYFLVSGKSRGMERYVAGLVRDLDLMDLKNRLCVIQEKLGIQLSDLAFAGMLMHLALCVKRLKAGYPVQFTQEESRGAESVERVETRREYQVMEYTLRPLEDLYGVSIPESEMSYLTMHLATAQMTKIDCVQDDACCGSLIRLLFEECQKEYGIDLSQDEELAGNLKVHLQPAILRMRYGVEVVNPILDIVKTRYPRSLITCRRAAGRFEEQWGMEISDSEIGYLVTYIELGLNKHGFSERQNVYRVAVVCTMGIGTSKILTSRIETEFSNMIVVDQISAMNITGYDFSGIDLVLSTVDISISLAKPVIVINPMLNREDIQKIADYILADGNQDIKLSQFAKILDAVRETCSVNDAEKLECALSSIIGLKKGVGTSRGLLDILLPEYCVCRVEADSWDAALRKAARPLLTDGCITQNYVEEMIRVKDKYKHYYMIGDSISMPHGAPESGVCRLAMSLATLSRPLVVETSSRKASVRIIVILAAVDNRQHSQALIDMTSLFDSGENIEILSEARTPEELYQRIQEVLEKGEKE